MKKSLHGIYLLFSAASLLIVYALAVTPVHLQAAEPGQGNTRFSITSTGTGYSATVADRNFYTGRSLFDVISVLPEITFENGSFCINGSRAAGIYLNGNKITDHNMLKYIPALSAISFTVTYAAAGDSSAGSDGGKIRANTDNGRLGGIVAAGNRIRPGNPADGMYVISSVSAENGANSFSNHLTYSGHRNTVSSREEKRFENAEYQPGPHITENTAMNRETHIDEKFAYGRTINEKHEIGFSAGFKYSLSDPSVFSGYSATDNPEQNRSSVTSNRLAHTEYSTEAGYSTSALPEGVTASMSVSYTGKDEKRKNSYEQKEEGTSSGDENSIHTDEAGCAFSFSVPLLKKEDSEISLATGAELDAVFSRYRLIDSYGETSFDANVESASTAGYTSRIYALVSGKNGELEYRAGVNLQANIVSYRDHTYGYGARNTQTGANPTFKIFRPLDSQKRFTVSFTYRHMLGSIPYRAISPYRYWTDEFNYVTGNTSLKSPQSDLAMLVFTLFSSKLNVGLSYRYDRNSIYFKKSEDPELENVMFTSPVNLEGSHTASVNTGVNFGISEFFKSRLFIRGDLVRENSVLDGIKYDNLRTRTIFSINNSISFGHGFSMELNGSWIPAYRLYEKYFPNAYSVYGSISKSAFSDRLRIAVDFTAFANSPGYISRNGDYTIYYNDMSDVRHIGISVSWIL